MSPAAVQSLEDFRQGVGVAVTVNSGFRSPKHQEDVCTSLSATPSVARVLAPTSRHMFGDAFDLPLVFYTHSDEELACRTASSLADPRVAPILTSIRTLRMRPA